MKTLLCAALLVVFTAPALAEFDLVEAQLRADHATLMCFDGVDHDGTPATEAQIKSACKDVEELAAELKANNICKTPDNILVKCPG